MDLKLHKPLFRELKKINKKLEFGDFGDSRRRIYAGSNSEGNLVMCFDKTVLDIFNDFIN